MAPALEANEYFMWHQFLTDFLVIEYWLRQSWRKSLSKHQTTGMNQVSSACFIMQFVNKILKSLLKLRSQHDLFDNWNN